MTLLPADLAATLTCPSCPPREGQMLRCDGGRFCRDCWVFFPTPGTKTGPSYRTPEKGIVGAARGNPEARLVAEIVDALRKVGRTVLRVGQWRADMAGSTAGCPDLFVWEAPAGDWPGRWIGIECKTREGRLSPAQKVLAEAGMVRVVRSIEEAFDACGERL